VGAETRAVQYLEQAQGKPHRWPFDYAVGERVEPQDRCDGTRWFPSTTNLRFALRTDDRLTTGLPGHAGSLAAEKEVV